MDLKRTGEREIPTTPGTIEGIDIKHLERYKWASSYTHGKRVYDVACGVGYGSLLLEASEYVGFDNSKEIIDYATEYYSINPEISFRQADATQMPSDIKVADVIVSFETIEHLNNPENLLSWCAAHGKMLIISSPIRGSFGRSHFHLFEYRLAVFEKVLTNYFSKVTLFVQKAGQGIIYPCLPEDKGVAIAVCQP